MTTQAKTIPITDILSKLGYNPKKTKGTEVWYLSPLRKENTPSFKVDTKLNLWYDHGSHQGGSGIDLIMNLRNFTVKEAFSELESMFATTSSFQQKTPLKSQNNSPLEEKENQDKINEENNCIKSIKPLEHKALIEYLESRKINFEIAKHYICEIHYQLNNMNFFAIGFQNDSKGFEIRSKHFKGSLKNSPKDITTIINPNEESKTLLIFEGFIDFLSLFTVNSFKNYQDLKDDVIVLNSVSFIENYKQFLLILC